MDVKEFFQAARKSWWLVSLLTLVGIAAGVGLTASKTPTYSSSVTFYVYSQSTADTTGSALQSGQYAQQLVNSYVKLVRSDRVVAAIKAGDPSIGLSVGQITNRITATAPLNTTVFIATATDTVPSRARDITSGISTAFGPIAATLGDPTKAVVKVTAISGPTAPVKVGPRKTLNYALGLLVGLALGLAIAALRQLLNTSLRTAEDLEALTSKPTIGQIGFDPNAKNEALVLGGQTRSVRAEAFRQLRTNLQFVDVDHPLGVIEVTSSTASEGKSMTSANLALVFAEAGSNVLLIEADLRRPRVAEYLGLDRSVGLTNVLAGQVKIEDVLQRWGESTLTVLSSGSVPPNPSELLGTQNMKDLLLTLRARFDMVIIDTPPLLPVTDAAVVSAVVDGVVVVVRHGKTTRAQLDTAVRSLRAVDAPILGFVLNMVPIKRSARNAYDGYGYYEDVQPSNSKGGSRRNRDGDAGTDSGSGRGKSERSEDTRTISAGAR